ncbi:flavin reductase family protein [Leclercia adecarboxylata]
MDCSIEQVASVGTHDVLYCAVKEIRLSQDKSSLIYHNRSYHRIQCLDD